MKRKTTSGRKRSAALLGALALTLALAAPAQAANTIPLAPPPSWAPFVQAAYGTAGTATLPPFPIWVDGRPIDNDSARYPILLYQDIVYLPMTQDFSQLIGLVTYWDAETETFCLRVSSKQGDYVPDTGHPHSGGSFAVKELSGMLSVNGVTLPAEAIQQEPYPYVVYDGVVYIPVTETFSENVKWSWSWDPDKGLIIDLERDITQEFLDWEAGFAGTMLE